MTFGGFDYKDHNMCMTETQKVQGKFLEKKRLEKQRAKEEAKKEKLAKQQ